MPVYRHCYICGKKVYSLHPISGKVMCGTCKNEKEKRIQNLEFDEKCDRAPKICTQAKLRQGLHKDVTKEKHDWESCKFEDLTFSQKLISAFDKQVGGNYYKQYKIQPYEFFFKNNITHDKAAIIRRILRYDQPGGKGLEDLEKIQHECDLLKELHGYKESVWKTRSDNIEKQVNNAKALTEHSRYLLILVNELSNWVSTEEWKRCADIAIIKYETETLPIKAAIKYPKEMKCE